MCLADNIIIVCTLVLDFSARTSAPLLLAPPSSFVRDSLKMVAPPPLMPTLMPTPAFLSFAIPHDNWAPGMSADPELELAADDAFATLSVAAVDRSVLHSQ